MVGILISYPAFSQSANIPDREVINSDLLSEKMKIFPNPSDGRFQIRLEYVGKEKITAKIVEPAISPDNKWLGVKKTKITPQRKCKVE